MSNSHAKIVVILTIYSVVLVFSWLYLSKSHRESLEELFDRKFKEQEQTIISIFESSEFTINLIEK